jgi:uncharacterized protein (DUF1697 family)
MAYVALIRGINVGGKSIVAMPALKASFEGMGFEGVRTYINSGNVIFRSPSPRRDRVEAALAADLGRDLTVVLRDTAQIGAVVDAIPDWENDTSYRSEVYFSDLFAKPDCVDMLPLTPGLEEVRFVPGAILCRIPRDRLTRTKLTRLAGTDLYRQMTARNCNTVRKLHQLMLAAG